jgi:molecular chaperone Hsp33
VNDDSNTRRDGDYLVRAVARDGWVRAFAVRATDTVGELARIHGTTPPATAALGRTAVGALLLAAASLKEPRHSLTVEVHGSGPLRRILVVATGAGEVRGLVAQPQADAPSVDGKLNVAGVVGRHGTLSVTKDLGLREPYRGTVELQTGEIGDDFAYYLWRSEQTPAAVGVGVFVQPDGRVGAAGGYLVQLLPGLSEGEVASLEAAIRALPHPTTMLREGETPERILERIFPEGYELLDRYPVRHRCTCSRARFEEAIVSLGPKEIEAIRAAGPAGEPVEVVCRFCHRRYTFSPEEMAAILEASTARFAGEGAAEG